MLKGHQPRVIYHQAYHCTKRNTPEVSKPRPEMWAKGTRVTAECLTNPELGPYPPFCFSPRKALRGGISKSILQRPDQFLAINAHKMAPRTTLECPHEGPSVEPLLLSESHSAAEREGDNLKEFKDPDPENGSSPGQNPALTVACVLNSPDLDEWTMLIFTKKCFRMRLDVF